MADNAGGSAPVDNSPSLAAVVGEMYGDYSDVEPDETEEAPSSVSSEATEPAELAEPEGSEPAEPAPDAEPAPADPDAEGTPTDAEPDPLEGSSPLAYVVNGESRSSEGITLLKDGGAIVDPDKVQWLQQRLSERDHLYERNQAQFKDLDALTKLTTWTPPGSDRAVSGHAAIEALHLSRAELMAEVNAYQALLSDPNNIRDVLTADDAGNLIWNRQGVDNFRLKLENIKARLGPAIQKHFAGMAAPSQQQAVAEPVTRESVVAAAPETVSAVLGALKISNLTDEDKAELAGILPDYVRIATPQDVQRDPALVLGRPFVDPRFVTFPKRLSAARGDAAKLVSSSTKVDAKNAARIAAASQGKNGKNAAKIPPQKEKQPTAQDNFDQAFDMREKAAAGALRAHAFGSR